MIMIFIIDIHVNINDIFYIERICSDLKGSDRLKISLASPDSYVKLKIQGEE